MGLDIVFYTEGLEFDGGTPFERALGGSETALVCMARELAALGHNVRVFCRCPRPGVYEYEGGMPPRHPHPSSPIKGEEGQARRRGAEPPPYRTGQEASSCPTAGLARVEYCDLSEFERFARLEECDVFVCSRFVHAIGATRFAKRHVLWCHDVLTEDTAPLVAGLFWKIDRLFVVSEFQKRQWQKHLSAGWRIPDNAFFVTRNGVDLQVVDGACEEDRPVAAPFRVRDERPDLIGAATAGLCRATPCGLPCGEAAGDPSAALPSATLRAGRTGGTPALHEAGAERVVYASRPERGLEVLLDMWPELKRRRPALELLICRYEHPQGDERMAAFLEALARKAESLEGVTFLGALSKPELYEVMRTCRLMVYPSTFPEVSCIAAIEAAACSLPIVTSKYCALKETVVDGETGILIGGDPGSEEYRKAFVDAVESLLADDERRQRMGRAARERVERVYQWSRIASEWSRHFEEWFADVPRRRALAHLRHNSDLIAARDAGLASEEQLGIAWLRDGADYNKHYERAWGEQAAGLGRPALHNLAAEIRNYRFEWLRRQVEGRPEIRSLVDVGCGGGQFAVGLANAIERLHVIGADVSELALARARECAEKHAADASRIRFEVWAEAMAGVGPSTSLRAGTPALHKQGKFDAVFVGEVLEHVPEVERFVEEVEALVNPGGWVFATMPFGPWESMSFRSDAKKGIEPSHVRSWSCRDVMDVFGKKADLDLCHGEAGRTPRGEPLGHWMLAYRAGPSTSLRAGGETGRYDYARKLRCNPRQSLSVCMILGGEEAGLTLHRCLKSARDVADEMIIAWSNCDEETLRIARQYADALFEIPWIEDDGLPNFAAARNRSIERARSDWILWIDADEYLVGAEELPKYLRENVYNAYVIRQWHHAIDSQFAPDTPMRCFRNGLGVRFYGAIHEHPETALNDGIKPHVILTDVNIVHDGYVTEPKRVGRFHRNLPILVKDRRLYPQRTLGDLFWLRDLVQAARHQMVQNALQGHPQGAPSGSPEGASGATVRSKRLLEEAVGLYRERFSDPSGEYHAQAMPFYQQALVLQGRGREMTLGVEPGRAELRPQTLRFESADEARRHLDYLCQHAFRALSPPDDFPFEE